MPRPKPNRTPDEQRVYENKQRRDLMAKKKKEDPWAYAMYMDDKRRERQQRQAKLADTHCGYHKHIPKDKFITVVKGNKEKQVCPKCRKLTLEKLAEARRKYQRDLKNLPDKFIAKRFVKGSKIAITDVPQAIIEIQRTAILLKREAARQERPIKNCKHHGDLTKEDVVLAGKSPWTGLQKYKCKLCLKDMHQRYYQKNKEKVNAKTKAWREANPERRREQCRRAHELEHARKKLRLLNRFPTINKFKIYHQLSLLGAENEQRPNETND